MTNVREQAERMAARETTENRARRAQVFATLDLADAIREAGENVREGLGNIDSSIVQLADELGHLDLNT